MRVELPDSALRPTTARELRSHGLTRWEVDGSPLWRSPFRGARTWASLPADDVLVRIAEAAVLVSPAGAVGDWAAATLRDVSGVVPSRAAVGLVLPPGPRRRNRDGVRFRRERLDPGEVDEVDGVPLTGRLRTWFDSARLLSLPDALAVADAATRDWALDLHEVVAYVREHAGWRGVPQARQVLALCDPRAASGPESRARLLWVGAAGLPPPEVNVPVLDLDGRLLGCPDLLDVDAGLVGECDGSTHRRADQHRADNRREEGFERAGLTVVRFDPYEVDFRPALLAARLRAGHADGMRRDRRRDRWYVPPSRLRHPWDGAA